MTKSARNAFTSSGFGWTPISETAEPGRLKLEPIERRYLESGWDSCVGSSGTVLAVEAALRQSDARRQAILHSSLDAIVTGSAIRPGDAVLGLPASGLHSNGYTLARHVLLGGEGAPGPFGLDDTPAELGGASIADALLEPTVIYVRAALDLLRSDIPVHGLAHITGDGLSNLLRLTGDRAGFRIDAPLPVPAIFDLIAAHGSVSTAEMWEVFNMGCGFVAVVPPDRADDAIALLSERHPGTAVIGTVTDEGGTITAPTLGVTGDRHGLRAG